MQLNLALQLMKKVAKRHLFISAGLAYNERGVLAE